MVDRLRARRFLAVLVAVLGLGLVGRWRWTTGDVLDMVGEAGGYCGTLSPVRVLKVLGLNGHDHLVVCTWLGRASKG